jgi:hypothetical protein
VAPRRGGPASLPFPILEMNQSTCAEYGLVMLTGPTLKGYPGKESRKMQPHLLTSAIAPGHFDGFPSKAIIQITATLRRFCRPFSRAISIHAPQLDVLVFG